MSLRDELRDGAKDAGRELAGEAAKQGSSWLLGRFFDWVAERRPGGWLARRRNKAQEKLNREMHAAVDKYIAELESKTPAERPKAKR
jgi:hypothetical protein